MITLITGARGSGKTSLCQQRADAARAAGLDVAGILSPALFEGGAKVGIAALDLRTGERRLLARRRQPGDSDTPGGPQTEGWRFDPTALAWADAVLSTATPCDLLVVDELGPLELERNEGWTAALTALDGGHYRAALVVVRYELLPVARSRWPGATVLDLGTGGEGSLSHESA
jgi:nucleoside-triphosphatase THEP1